MALMKLNQMYSCVILMKKCVCTCACAVTRCVLLFPKVDAVNVSPGTQYTVTVTAASSSNISPGVSRMITTNESGETLTDHSVCFRLCGFYFGIFKNTQVCFSAWLFQLVSV